MDDQVPPEILCGLHTVVSLENQSQWGFVVVVALVLLSKLQAITHPVSKAIILDFAIEMLPGTDLKYSACWNYCNTSAV